MTRGGTSVIAVCFSALALSGACGGQRREAEAARPTEEPEGAVAAKTSAPSQDTVAAPAQAPDRRGTNGEPTEAAGPGSVAGSCANGTAVCAAPTPYCCKLVDADSEPNGLGECVAHHDQCESMEFACTSEHKDCPSTEGRISLGCAEDDNPGAETVGANGAAVYRCDPGKACHCVLRFVRNQASHAAEAEFSQQYNESLNCASIADCERFCSRDLKAHPKLRSSACDRLVDAAEQLVNGSEGSAGVGQGVAALARACEAALLPAGGARATQAKACEVAAQQYFWSSKIPRSFAKAQRYFGRACKLTGADLACGTEVAAACIVRTWTPGRRTPDLDRWCNDDRPPQRWTTRAYLPEDPTRRLEFDSCFSPMREIGCTGVNVGPRTGLMLPKGQDLKSAFCCRGDRP